jgi:hypothetical protein
MDDNNKTVGIVATIATTLLCGCPGLFSVCFGAIMAFAGLVPGADIDIAGSSDPAAAIMTGVVTLCVGVIFVAIPIVVGFVTLRKKPAAAAATVVDHDEPLPPAI